MHTQAYAQAQAQALHTAANAHTHTYIHTHSIYAQAQPTQRSWRCACGRMGQQRTQGQSSHAQSTGMYTGQVAGLRLSGVVGAACQRRADNLLSWSSGVLGRHNPHKLHDLLAQAERAYTTCVHAHAHKKYTFICVCVCMCMCVPYIRATVQWCLTLAGCACVFPLRACSCAVVLDRLAVAASVAKVPPPGGGWRVFEQRLEALTHGEVRTVRHLGCG